MTSTSAVTCPTCGRGLSASRIKVACSGCGRPLCRSCRLRGEEGQDLCPQCMLLVIANAQKACPSCGKQVPVPIQMLPTCPGCSRGYCSDCQVFCPRLGEHVCPRCGQLDLAVHQGQFQATLWWTRAAFSAGVGLFGAWMIAAGLAMGGMLLAALGSVSVFWHMLGFRPCPRCGGKSDPVAGETKHRFCSLCGYQWSRS